jgi:UDP-N-acetylmuramyl tripeptide synthase
MALCRELGIGAAAMATGLQQFQGDEADNPGRGNWFHKNGISILVDFAHNEHGMLALADMLSRLPAERRLLLISQAGDRSDKDIIDMTSAACGMHPDEVFLCDLPGYERGRGPSDVAHIIRGSAIESGVAPGAIEHHPTPKAAVAAALEKAQPGDLLVLLILTQRNAVLEMIHGYLDH